jgi:hypothetical protein
MFGRIREERIKAFVEGNLSNWLAKQTGAARPIGPAELQVMSDLPEWVVKAKDAGATICRFSPSAKIIAQIDDVRTLLFDVDRIFSARRDNAHLKGVVEDFLAGLRRMSVPAILRFHDDWFAKRAALSADASLDAAGSFDQSRAPLSNDPHRVDVSEGMFWVPIPQPWLKRAGQRLSNCLAAGYYAQEVASGAMQIWGLFSSEISDDNLLAAARSVMSRDGWRLAEYQAWREASSYQRKMVQLALGPLIMSRFTAGMNMPEHGILWGKLVASMDPLEDMDIEALNIAGCKIDLRICQEGLVENAGDRARIILDFSGPGSIQIDDARAGHIIQRILQSPDKEGAANGLRVFGDIIRALIRDSGRSLAKARKLGNNHVVDVSGRLLAVIDLPQVAHIKSGEVEWEARLIESWLIIRHRIGTEEWSCSAVDKIDSLETVSGEDAFAFLRQAAAALGDHSPNIVSDAVRAESRGFATRIMLPKSYIISGPGSMWVHGHWSPANADRGDERCDIIGFPSAQYPEFSVYRAPSKSAIHDHIMVSRGAESLLVRCTDRLIPAKRWENNKGDEVRFDLPKDRHLFIAAAEEFSGKKAADDLLRALCVERSADGGCDLFPIKPTEALVDGTPFRLSRKELMLFHSDGYPRVCYPIKGGTQLAAGGIIYWYGAPRAPSGKDRGSEGLHVAVGARRASNDDINLLLQAALEIGIPVPNRFGSEIFQARVEALGWSLKNGIPYKGSPAAALPSFSFTVPQLEGMLVHVESGALSGVKRPDEHATDHRTFRVVVTFDAADQTQAGQAKFVAYVDDFGCLSMARGQSNHARLAVEGAFLQFDLGLMLALRELSKRTALSISSHVLRSQPWISVGALDVRRLSLDHALVRRSLMTSFGQWKMVVPYEGWVLGLDQHSWVLETHDGSKLAVRECLRKETSKPSLIIYDDGQDFGVPVEDIVHSWRALEKGIASTDTVDGPEICLL